MPGCIRNFCREHRQLLMLTFSHTKCTHASREPKASRQSTAFVFLTAAIQVAVVPSCIYPRALKQGAQASERLMWAHQVNLPYSLMLGDGQGAQRPVKCPACPCHQALLHHEFLHQILCSVYCTAVPHSDMLRSRACCVHCFGLQPSWDIHQVLQPDAGHLVH